MVPQIMFTRYLNIMILQFSLSASVIEYGRMAPKLNVGCKRCCKKSYYKQSCNLDFLSKHNRLATKTQKM